MRCRSSMLAAMLVGVFAGTSLAAEVPADRESAARQRVGAGGDLRAEGPLRAVRSVLPPGWEIRRAVLTAKSVRPPGYVSGRGVQLTLLHSPIAGTDKNTATLELFVLRDKVKLQMDPPPAAQAEYWGRGDFGEVYFFADTGKGELDPLSRWRNAAFDLATALGVVNIPSTPPAGPDWGRVLSGVLADCAGERRNREALARFCLDAQLSSGHDGKPLIRYESNLVRGGNVQPPAGTEPMQPYYDVWLSILPNQGATQIAPSEADRSIKWDGQAASRSYRVKRLGIDIAITVSSDDRDFVRILNGILDRRITAALAAAPAAAVHVR